MKDAQTYADYISYDMEHAPYDIKGLADYMRGLVAGGPTKSGHRTPAVIVNVPVNGTDEATVRANAWMFHQVLATGVHGIMLTHADTPGAVRALVESSRLPIHKQGVGKGVDEGRRGAHGTPTAAPIWGVSQDEYVDKADAWPLNPDGELLLGLKLEDKYALANADAEPEGARHRVRRMGTGRHGAVAGRPRPRTRNHGPRWSRRGPRCFAACKANKMFFLNSMNPEQRGRDDPGRRDGRAREPAGCRDRPSVHEASDAVVARSSAGLQACRGCAGLKACTPSAQMSGVMLGSTPSRAFP